MAQNIVGILSTLSTLFSLLILARIVFSWIQVDRYNPVVAFIFNVTEPILAPIRNFLPSVAMFDFSPLVAILLAEVVVRILSAIVLSVF
ncbi:MAG: YggT family protein [Chloroflexota bacterium]